MKHLLLFAFLIFNFELAASDRITATITVTNVAANLNTFTVNGNVRTWTNQVFTSSIQILVTNTANWTKTNLFTHIALNPFANIIPVDTGSNTFTLNGLCGGALSVSASGTYASITYSTQTCAVATPVGVPFANYYPSLITRTNTASQLVTDLNAYSTTAIDQTAPIAGQLVGTNNTQTIIGRKTFSNTNGFFGGLITSLAISGNSVLLTNGLYLTPIFSSPKMTNGLNYGNAFSSPGATGIASEQFGAGAVATKDAAVAIGPIAQARGIEAVGVGEDAEALADFTIAIGGESLASVEAACALGESSAATGFGAIAVGVSSSASGSNAMAFGRLAQASFDNSFAFGSGSATTAANQVMLGKAGQNVNVPNSLLVQTNATIGGGLQVLGLNTNAAFTGTNNFPAGADIAFGRFPVASLANGNNAAVPVGTNVFVEVSGPSGAFTICGIAGGRDGKYLVIVNQTGFDMTIAHQSGTDPTAANRIISMTGADRVTTGNGTATLIYSASASRWLLINFDP